MVAAARRDLTHAVLALSAAAITWQTYLLAALPVRWPFVAVVLFSTLLIYRIAWYGLKFPLSYDAVSKIVIAFSIAVCIYFFNELLIEEKAGLFIMLFFCLFYFAEAGSWKGLRSLTFVKSFWVALVWTVVTAWIPCHFSSDHGVLMVVAERLLFMNAVCLIYNLRDVKHDYSRGITTVPLRFGAGVTKGMAFTMLAFNAALVSFHGYELYILIPLLVSVLVTALISFLAVPDGNWLYYTLAVDGSLLLQALLVISFYVQN